MTILEYKSFFMWCAIFNYVALTIWFIAFKLARPAMYRFSAQWFMLDPKVYDAIHYGGMGLYKVSILFLNFIPWLALVVMT